MALTDAQKYRVIRLLGYPYGTLSPASLDYSKIISDKLDAVSDSAETEVEQLITWIDQTEDQMDSAMSSTGVKRVDDIEFFADGEGSKVDGLRRERKRYIDELAGLLGIPNMTRARMGRVCV